MNDTYTKTKELLAIDAAEEAILEALVDACGLATVLAALADVCVTKAEHARTNWVTEPLKCGLPGPPPSSNSPSNSEATP